LNPFPKTSITKSLEPVRSSKINSDEVVFRLFDTTIIGKKREGLAYRFKIFWF